MEKKESGAVAGCNTKFFQNRIFKGCGKLRTINTMETNCEVGMNCVSVTYTVTYS